MSSPDTVIEDTQLTGACHKFEGHTDCVRCTIYLPGRQQIMTCSSDGLLGVWNLRTGKRVASWRDGEGAVHSIELSLDGKKVVSGSYDGVVRLWSIETGKVITRWTGHTNVVHSVRWNGDGKRVLSGSRDGTVRVWDVETGKIILDISTGMTHVFTAIFSPDSTFIATGGISLDSGGFIKIWNANTGKLVSTLIGHSTGVYCLAWTANGRTLVSGSADCTIRTWNTSTWQQRTVKLTDHTHTVRGIAISPNGRVLASASLDNTARLWNLENGQPIGLPLMHADSVTCVSFSADGKILVTGCWDKKAYTWDILTTIKEAGSNELLASCPSRHPVQQPKGAHTISTDFFTESPSHFGPDVVHSISPPVVPKDAPPQRARLHFFDWFRGNIPALPTILRQAKFPFFKRPQRQDEEGIELKERLNQVVAVVDVPFAPGRLRHASADGVCIMKSKEKKKKKDEEDEKKKEKAKAKQAKISAGQSQAQPSSELYSTIFTSPVALTNPISASATMSATPPLDTVNMQGGCWTLLLRYMSVPHPSGRH